MRILNDMSKLKLMRFEDKTEQNTEMHVFLNGKELAVLSNGERKEVEILAGKHEIKVKTDRFGSRNFPLKIQDDEIKSLVISFDKEGTAAEPIVSGVILLDLICNGFMVWYHSVMGDKRHIKIEKLSMSV